MFFLFQNIKFLYFEYIDSCHKHNIPVSESSAFFRHQNCFFRQFLFVAGIFKMFAYEIIPFLKLIYPLVVIVSSPEIGLMQFSIRSHPERVFSIRSIRYSLRHF